jgi:hypothetical protein
MKTIYQICLGNIPEHIQPQINSVSAFAKLHGYQYHQIKEYPVWSVYMEKNYKTNRYISEIIRMDILSTEPDVICIDWDVELTESFQISDIPMFAGDSIDCIVSNGKRSDIFKNIVLDFAPLRDDSDMMSIPLFRAITMYMHKHPEFKFDFVTKGFKHTNNFQFNWR